MQANPRFTSSPAGQKTLRVSELPLAPGLALCLAVVLVGCATVPPPRPGSPKRTGLETTIQKAEPEPTTKQPEPTSGSIAVENRLDEAVTLFLEGNRYRELAGGETTLIPGLPEGPLKLEARSTSGRRITHEFDVAPGVTETWVLQAGESRLLVRNLVDEDVILFVDGHRTIEMARGSAAHFPVTTGPHTLAAHCPATGYAQKKTVKVTGGTVVEVAFGPQGGRLAVENGTHKQLSLYRNGHPLATLAAGKSIEFGAQPLGTSVVEALDEDRRLVLRQKVALKASGEGPTRLVIGDVTAKVVVQNRTGEDVKVDPTLNSLTPVIKPGEDTVVFRVGEISEVKLKGADSATRYDRKVHVKPGETRTVVLQPVVGGIVVENLSGKEVAILLDQTSVANLKPDEKYVATGVAPGQHYLEAKAAGKLVERTSCVLVADSWYVWRLTPGRGSLKVSNRTPEDLRLLVGSQVAGVLPPGTETELAGLPAGTTTLTAVGVDSLQHHRLTVTSDTLDNPVWNVRPATSGLRVFGLKGQAARVYVDGAAVRDILAGEEEPVHVPLDPGEHTVWLTLPDGSARAALVNAAQNVLTDFRMSGAEPSVEVRNLTSGVITIWVDGRRLQELEAGKNVVVGFELPGIHTITAVNAEKNREWRLQNVYFREGGKFGWSLRD